MATIKDAKVTVTVISKRATAYGRARVPHVIELTDRVRYLISAGVLNATGKVPPGKGGTRAKAAATREQAARLENTTPTVSVMPAVDRRTVVNDAQVIAEQAREQVITGPTEDIGIKDVLPSPLDHEGDKTK